MRIPVPKPVREPNRCNLEPFKPETPEIALYLVYTQGRLTLQVVCLGLAHFRLPLWPRYPLALKFGHIPQYTSDRSGVLQVMLGPQFLLEPLPLRVLDQPQAHLTQQISRRRQPLSGHRQKDELTCPQFSRPPVTAPAKSIKPHILPGFAVHFVSRPARSPRLPPVLRFRLRLGCLLLYSGGPRVGGSFV